MTSIYQKLVVATACTTLSIVASQSADAASLYSLTDLGSLTESTYSYAVNNSGEVVGRAQGEWYTHGTVIDVSVETTVAYGINNPGQVVGWSGTTSDFYLTSGSGIRALLYSDGVMQDLNNLIVADSGFILTQAQAINDRGEIAGAGSINGELHAILLTPHQEVPEPASVPEPTSVLGLLALGTLGASKSFNKKQTSSQKNKSLIVKTSSINRQTTLITVLLLTKSVGAN